MSFFQFLFKFFFFKQIFYYLLKIEFLGVSKEWASNWIQYHASIGFTRLFIFWDCPECDRETIDWLNDDPLYNWVTDNYEPDKEYKKTYWAPNKTSDHFEQWTLPAYGVHADTEITAR